MKMKNMNPVGTVTFHLRNNYVRFYINQTLLYMVRLETLFNVKAEIHDQSFHQFYGSLEKREEKTEMWWLFTRSVFFIK